MKPLERVEFAISQMLIDDPFYALQALRLKLRLTRSCPTFRTDGQEMRVNPDFLATLKGREVCMVAAEEVIHCMAGHLWRAPAGCDWKLWNRAADQEARCLLEEANEKARQTGRDIPFPFPAPEFAAQPEFKGMAAEAVYAALMQRSHGAGGQQPRNQQSGQGQQPSGPGQANQQGQPGHQPSTDQLSTNLGEFELPAGDSPADQSELRREWENAAVQAAQAAAARGRGDLPSFIQRLVQRIKHPPADIGQIIRDFCRRVVAEDYDWLRPNMRYAESGFMLPSLRSEKVGKVVFATDTSGSIDDRLLAIFRSQKQWVLDELEPESLVDVFCDASVQKVEEYLPGDQIGEDAPGGGGTNFRPVFDLVDAWDEPPRLVVYLTDLEGTYPKREPDDYPVLWVTWDKTTTPPWGELVRADLEDLAA